MAFDKKQILKALRSGPGEGQRLHELAVRVGANDKEQHRLPKLMSQLIEEGLVEKAAGSRYRFIPAEGAAPAVAATSPKEKPAPSDGRARPGEALGKIKIHPAGYGFVVREDGEEDVHIGVRYRGLAIDGDRVRLRVWTGDRGTEGRVEEVVERGRTKLTGTLRSAGDGRKAFVEPDDPRIIATSGHVRLTGGTRPAKGGEARDGQAVVVEITHYPEVPDEPLSGRIVHVLGTPGEPATEIAKILISADIPDELPADVIAEDRSTPSVVRPEDLNDRVDLREHAFFTIDPETARDFDDAVCVEPSTNGRTRLWVAVADVSHYVRPGTAIDREAEARGCSVYLPNRAISMLPEALSSGICSLNPAVDRLAMVTRLEVADDGSVHEPYFCAAVIRSRARMDYASVGAALAGDLRGPRASYEEHLPTLRAMAELSTKLRKRRSARGALDFDLPETKIILDQDDPLRVRDVVQSRSNPEIKGAYQMIEDFMLAANEAVAAHLGGRERDGVWRVHDVPSDERLGQLSSLAESFGIQFSVEDGRSPKKLRDFLAGLPQHGPGVARALNSLTLRALKQAQYDVVNVGHFGLAASDYLHFTSPIRRYPDLIDHRLMKALLAEDGIAAGGPPPPVPTRVELAEMAQRASSHERRAMEAEREVVDLYRALFMRDHIGDEYDGIVSAATSFGLFVQVEAPFVEGLVKLDRIGDDFYELDKETMRLVGRRSGHAFSLGDPVRVRVEDASVARRQIDFALVTSAATTAVAASGITPRYDEHYDRPAKSSPPKMHRPAARARAPKAEAKRKSHGQPKSRGKGPSDPPKKSKNGGKPDKRGGGGFTRGPAKR